MPSHKSQHYVPQFLLRNFSHDEKYISLWNFARRKAVHGVPIKSQCAKNYFYGKDLWVEKWLGSIETHFSQLARTLIREAQIPLHNDDAFNVRSFALLQHMRTAAAAAESDSITAGMISVVRNQSTKEVRDRLENPPPGHPTAQQACLEAAITSLPLVQDLGVKILTNDHDEGFILSDNPVVLQNQWAERAKVFSHILGKTGLAVRGLLIYMPLSPTTMICLYDSDVYRVGGRNSSVRASKKDVRNLNKLQAVNAQQNLYFEKGSLGENVLKELARIREGHPDVHVAEIYEGPVVNVHDGDTKNMVSAGTPDVRIDARISSVTIVENVPKGPYRYVVLPPRSVERIRISEQAREVWHNGYQSLSPYDFHRAYKS
jgi:hypothetical protein